MQFGDLAEADHADFQMAAQEIGPLHGRAAIGDFVGLHLGGARQHADRQMSVRACAVMAERHRTWFAAQCSHNIGQRCELAVRRHHDHAGVVDHARDQADFIHAVLGLSRHRDEIIAGHVDDADRVGVRRGALDRSKGDLAAGAGLVQHDKLGLSTQPLLDERQKLARHDVGRAAGRKADDDFDRLVVRPSGMCCSASCDPDYCCNQRDDPADHDIPPFSCCLTIAPLGQHDRYDLRGSLVAAWLGQEQPAQLHA
jgi:hypothetical protein